MAVREILTYPNPKLREIAREVKNFDQELLQLVEDMRETMEYANGIGLAAPQIGVGLRVLVMAIPTEENAEPIRLEICNPKIIKSEGQAKIEEGCLSLPDFYVEVDRAEKIWVEAYSPQGEKLEFEAEGLISICLQHEMDHLEGKLLVNYVSPLKRNLYKKSRTELTETAQLI